MGKANSSVGRKLFVITVLNLFVVCCLHGCGGGIESRNSGASARDLASIPAPETQLLKKLMWPLAKHRITQEFKDEELFSGPHDGIDIAAPKGTRIYAPADGLVVYAGQKFNGYGKMIVIEHSQRLATIFGHLQTLLVKSGEKVTRGSLIGLVGKTGHATGPHLHFEVRLNRKPVNPLAYLP